MTEKNSCIDCVYGATHETSHEWIETYCELDKKWHSPFFNACERFVCKYEEVQDDGETD